MPNSSDVTRTNNMSGSTSKVSLHQSLSRVCKQWPGLWPEWRRRRFRPVVHGIADRMHSYVKANPDGLMTHSDVARVMRFVTNQLGYLEQIKEGAERFDWNGQPAGRVTAQEEDYSRRRIAEISVHLAKKNQKSADNLVSSKIQPEDILK